MRRLVDDGQYEQYGTAAVNSGYDAGRRYRTASTRAATRRLLDRCRRVDRRNLFPRRRSTSTAGCRPPGDSPARCTIVLTNKDLGTPDWQHHGQRRRRISTSPRRRSRHLQGHRDLPGPPRHRTARIATRSTATRRRSLPACSISRTRSCSTTVPERRPLLHDVCRQAHDVQRQQQRSTSSRSLPTAAPRAAVERIDADREARRMMTLHLHSFARTSAAPRSSSWRSSRRSSR